MMTAIDAPCKTPDGAQRERALNPAASFIVRAPAGSGKTELLTRRFLRLLAIVEEPEEILAITFTRAATAEMRGRVLRELDRAGRTEPSPGEAENLKLARAALARSEACGWRLLEQPHRLTIETIDSLCLRIAHNQPLLARMGGGLQPSEDAGGLYTDAARRTLGRLGATDAELDMALAHLLQLRDNNLAECERLLAQMLERRDQWVEAFPLTGSMSEEQWEMARSVLEKPFREEVKRVCGEAYRLLTRESFLATELLELAHYACENGNAEVATLSAIHALPAVEAMSKEHWQSICAFLLTKDGSWRQRFTKTEGFPSTTAAQKKMKERMNSLMARLQQAVGLNGALGAIRELPEPRYEEEQWTTLRHIFMALRQAVAELRVLFAERNTVDFVEVSLAARTVLRTADPDALRALTGDMRHILVDEFQDTSRSQHELLQLLARAWEAEDMQTCFFVGDPMQSIYLFRQAEVELFEHARRHGLIAENRVVPLEPLDLVTNFRSHEGLTTRWNEMFDAVFARSSGTGAARVEYTHAFAAQQALPNEGVHVHPQIVGSAESRATPDEKARAREREAELALEIIEQHVEEIRQAEASGGEYRVAVLARARTHLARIMALLRERGIPFRAVDLESLDERQELIDLMSLTRAMLHPMDRVAWLAVLRAPWCGLTMRDLHALSGVDDFTFRKMPVPELIRQRASLLSKDGAARAERITRILEQALAMRFEAESFSQWIERTWRSLGGPQCVDEAAYENAQAFFATLDAVTPDGMRCLTEDFEAEMKRLFAPPDPTVSERAGVQLMTIHKAKGLGFDVVIVPGLDRKSGRDDQPLVCSLERVNARGESELLVAPIGYRGSEKHPTYAWVQAQIKARTDEELKRLLYVASTRARRSLHLLGTATMGKSGVRPGDAKSLLATAWPALAQEFEQIRSVQHETRTAEVIPFPVRAESVSLDLAAGMTEIAPSLRLRRLPADLSLDNGRKNVAFAAANSEAAEPLPERPHGSRDARQKGNVVHALLERLSQGASHESLPAAARSLLRAAAYSDKALEDSAAEVMTAVEQCLADPDGAWILKPHAQARSEASWTGWRNGTLETLRADRVFLAGAEPRAEGTTHLWIIDYKMSAPAGDADFLAHERERYAGQLARYARALRDAEGVTQPVRFGLYYPRIARLDWWSEEP